MARFNISKYDPRDDSSTTASDYYTDDPNEPGFLPDESVILDRREGKCLCGCRNEPLGDNSRFKMGHDARLKGILIRAHLTNTEVVSVDDGGLVSGPAYTEARNLGDAWVDFLVASEEANLKGRTVELKVGRWDRKVKVLYVNGSESDVEYQTADGETTRSTVPTSRVVAALR